MSPRKGPLDERQRFLQGYLPEQRDDHAIVLSALTSAGISVISDRPGIIETETTLIAIVGDPANLTPTIRSFIAGLHGRRCPHLLPFGAGLPRTIAFAEAAPVPELRTVRDTRELIRALHDHAANARDVAAYLENEAIPVVMAGQVASKSDGCTLDVVRVLTEAGDVLIVCPPRSGDPLSPRVLDAVRYLELSTAPELAQPADRERRILLRVNLMPSQRDAAPHAQLEIVTTNGELLAKLRERKLAVLDPGDRSARVAGASPGRPSASRSRGSR